MEKCEFCKEIEHLEGCPNTFPNHLRQIVALVFNYNYNNARMGIISSFASNCEYEKVIELAVNIANKKLK